MGANIEMENGDINRHPRAGKNLGNPRHGYSPGDRSQEEKNSIQADDSPRKEVIKSVTGDKLPYHFKQGIVPQFLMRVPNHPP
jgi:hypothetical protein